jgi:hypothetical protein
VSIDARVRTVLIFEDGGGALLLEDRPARRPSDTPGIAGQARLTFADAPEEVTALNGLDLWGGDDRLMLGEHLIARRLGYTRIAFVDAPAFKAATAAYHARQR